MSDSESHPVGGESGPAVPQGMSEAQLLGGPSHQGTSSVPMTAPNGASFTFWAHSPGLPHSLYLVYPAGAEDAVIRWAADFANIVQNAMAAQKYMRERSVRKMAERAANQPAQLPAHRPRRVANPASFVPPQPSAQGQYQPQGQPPSPAQAMQGGLPYVAPPAPAGPFPHAPAAPQGPGSGQPFPRRPPPQTAQHHPHPAGVTVPQSQLDQEAEVARARVRQKEQLAQGIALMERFASSPEGASVMKRILEEGEAKRAALFPPGSAGAMAMGGQPMVAPPVPNGPMPPQAPPAAAPTPEDAPAAGAHAPNGTPSA